MKLIFAAAVPTLIHGISSYRNQKNVNEKFEAIQEDNRRHAVANLRRNELAVAEAGGHTSIFPAEMYGIRHLEMMIAQTINQ